MQLRRPPPAFKGLHQPRLTPLLAVKSSPAATTARSERRDGGSMGGGSGSSSREGGGGGRDYNSRTGSFRRRHDDGSRRDGDGGGRDTGGRDSRTGPRRGGTEYGSSAGYDTASRRDGGFRRYSDSNSGGGDGGRGGGSGGSGGGGGGGWARDQRSRTSVQREEKTGGRWQRPSDRRREERGRRQEEDDDARDVAADDDREEEYEDTEEDYGGWRGKSSSSSSEGFGDDAMTSSLRDSLQGEVLYGVFPVLAALKAGRRKVHRAFLLSSLDLSKRKDAGLLRQVLQLCEAGGVPLQRVGRHALNLLSHDRPHQGLALDVAPLEWTQLEEFPAAASVVATAGSTAAGAADAAGATAGAAAVAAPPVWLALDEVVDPQNLGAVVRSAYCLGAAGVLACARNCAPLSAAVSKASAGTLEVLPLHSCRNLPRTLIDARDNKGWTVLGAAAGSGSRPVGQLRVAGPTILVLGSEGFGLRTNVRRACSGLVRVDMAPGAASAAAAAAASAAPTAAPTAAAAASSSLASLQLPSPQQPQPQALRGLFDSLNVSVATGILLHSLLHSATAEAAVAPAEGAGEAMAAELTEGSAAVEAGEAAEKEAE